MNNFDAETLLLIYDDERAGTRDDGILKERMRADQHIDGACGKTCEDGLPLACIGRSAQHLPHDARAVEQRPHALGMLPS